MPTFIIMFCISKKKNYVQFLLINTNFYLLSNLFYEMNQQFQILRKSSINVLNFCFKTQNSKDSFKKSKLNQYNRKSDFCKHLGTYTKFYLSNCYKIKQYYTTSVIFNHKFLTSEDIKLLKTFYKLKKKKFIQLFSIIANSKFLVLSYKILISKLQNSKFLGNNITLKQIKYKWFKKLSFRLVNNNFKFIFIYDKINLLKYKHKLIKLSFLRNQIVYQSIELILELLYEQQIFKTNKLLLKKNFHYFLFKNFKLDWTKILWILKIKIQNTFSKYNLKRLYNLLSLKIKDQLFLKLLKELFKTPSVKENFLLFDIYIHLLDLKIIRIQKKLTVYNNNLKENKYKKNKLKKLRILSLLKYGFILSYKNQSILRQFKLKNINYSFKTYQLKYIRYKNYLLLGFYCLKKRIKQIEKQITFFCNSNLNLFILKKKLINFKANKIEFLNYDIYLNVFTTLQNSKNRIILLKVPLKNLKKILHQYKLMSKSNKPKPVIWLLSYSNDLIVNWFFSLAKSILEYYTCCLNFFKVKIYVNYIIKYSALYTLSLKNKLTLSEVIYKWSNNIIIKDKKNNILAKFFN